MFVCYSLSAAVDDDDAVWHYEVMIAYDVAVQIEIAMRNVDLIGLDLLA